MLWVKAAFSEQVTIDLDLDHPKERIAIVGAGAGGTAAAYYLQKYTSHGYDITIFEKNDGIGGRTTTTGIYGNSSRPFEVGASVFVSANLILTKAAEEFNLSLSEFRLFLDKDTQLSKIGLYDGESIFFEFGDSWKSQFKLVWRYGWSPIKVANIVKQFISDFLKYFYRDNFPFADLNSITKISGFYAASSITGEDYFRDAGVKESYYKEFLQSISRYNYAQNLDQIHAVGALVSLSANSALQVEGGNWQIFEKLAKQSKATLKLATDVTSATKLPDGKWSLQYANESAVFDKVIIASPFKSANISFADDYPIPEIEYVDLFVTIFTSNEKLSPAYFGKDESTEIPGTILTTVYLSDTPNLKFFTISILEYLEDTKDYVYKIFSPKLFTDKDLAKFFTPEVNISWVHRKEWRSYPYLRPLQEFTDFELDEGLWHLNSMETFISTMETSALAGANVAALISKGKNTTELTVP